MENRKVEISEYYKQPLYLEAYSPREKLKFKEIPEVSKALGPHHTIMARCFKIEILKCGGKLNVNEYRMHEDIPKELHILSKAQMNKLKKSRRWMLTSSSGPQLGFTV